MVGSARKREPEPVGLLKWSEANRTRIAMAPHEANPNPFKNVAIPTSLLYIPNLDLRNLYHLLGLVLQLNI